VFDPGNPTGAQAEFGGYDGTSDAMGFELGGYDG
jgi:hypothetical protein